jgi:SPP1 family predicted phage head-tail adaptor
MIGAMRQRVMLQGRAEIADAGGGVALTWSDIAEIWAEVTPLSGGETVQAMHVTGTMRHLVRLRCRSDVNSERRFLFKGRVLNIRSARNVEERGRWLECICEEGAAS